MPGDTTQDTLKLDVVLDPEGLRSQLAHLKQQVGMELAGTSFSVGQSMGALGAGFNSLNRDMSSLMNAVMFQPTPIQDASRHPGSLLSGLVPQLTAPRSYDVGEWGQLHRDAMFKSLSDATYRATLAAPGVAAGWAGFNVGSGFTAGLVGGGLVGGIAGIAGGLVAGGVAATAADSFMDPLIGRYQAAKALEAAGSRIGVSASQATMDAFGRAVHGTGTWNTEAAGVLQAGLEGGVIGQSGSPEAFGQQFRQLLRGAQDVSRMLHTELTESVQVISQLQHQGFSSIQSSVDAIRQSRILAKTTGITDAEAMSLGVTGAAMTVGGLGMSAGYGQRAISSAFEGVTHALRGKTLDMETITQLGGRASAAKMVATSGLAHLESPFGRAMLLAAYDPASGSLDPSKVMVEPGMAFRGAMENVLSGANPMRTLLEFAGNRQRLASQASPEEVALSQATTWAALARHIDPKGPITTDMLVGAATVFGTNPDVARATVGMVTNPGALEARQRALMEESAKITQERAGEHGGLFGSVTRAASDVSRFATGVFDTARSEAQLKNESVGEAFSNLASNTFGVFSRILSPYRVESAAVLDDGVLSKYLRSSISSGGRGPISGSMVTAEELGKRYHAADNATALFMRRLASNYDETMLATATGGREAQKAIMARAPEIVSALRSGDPAQRQAVQKKLLEDAAAMPAGSGKLLEFTADRMFRMTGGDPERQAALAGFEEALGSYAEGVVQGAGANAGIELLQNIPMAREVMESTSRREGLAASPQMALRGAVVKILRSTEGDAGALRLMREDIRRVAGLGSKDMPLSAIDSSKLQGFDPAVLARHAGEDKVLSPRELADAAVEQVVAHAAKRGLGRGPAAFSVEQSLSSASLSDMMQKTSRALQGVSELLDALKAKVGTSETEQWKN